MSGPLVERLAAAGQGPDDGGRVVVDERGRPLCWLSDGQARPGDWDRWARRFPRTGLWPLLAGDLGGRLEDGRPWRTGELGPATLPDRLPDAGDVLARGWAQAVPEEDLDDEVDVAQVLAPFGPAWPGPAPTGTLAGDPHTVAAAVADELAAPGRRWLALVAVDRGADCLDALGWWGTANHGPAPGERAAVLRSWEERFAARVVGLSFDVLDLAVAAPPHDARQAAAVAAEHFAWCPDAVTQGTETVSALAEDLVGRTAWSLWWD